MFDIGAVELMVIAIVTIIVVGPKDLPGMLRNFGQFVSKMRAMAREFQNTFEEAARDTGIDDITKGVSDVKNFSVTKDIGKVFDPVTQEAATIKSDIEDAGKVTSSESTAASSDTATEKPSAAKKTAKATPAKKAAKPAARRKPAAKKPAAAKSSASAKKANAGKAAKKPAKAAATAKN